MRNGMNDDAGATVDLNPPARSRASSDYGFACDPNVMLATKVRPSAVRVRHVGCPGWWPSTSDNGTDGWCCACSCHAAGAGWPGTSMARSDSTVMVGASGS